MTAVILCYQDINDLYQNLWNLVLYRVYQKKVPLRYSSIFWKIISTGQPNFLGCTSNYSCMYTRKIRALTHRLFLWHNVVCMAPKNVLHTDYQFWQKISSMCLDNFNKNSTISFRYTSNWYMNRYTRLNKAYLQKNHRARRPSTCWPLNAQDLNSNADVLWQCKTTSVCNAFFGVVRTTGLKQKPEGLEL